MPSIFAFNVFFFFSRAIPIYLFLSSTASLKKTAHRQYPANAQSVFSVYKTPDKRLSSDIRDSCWILYSISHGLNNVKQLSCFPLWGSVKPQYYSMAYRINSGKIARYPSSFICMPSIVYSALRFPFSSFRGSLISMYFAWCFSASFLTAAFASAIFWLVRTRRQGGFHLAQDLIVVINHLRDRNVRVTQIVDPEFIRDKSTNSAVIEYDIELFI